MCFTKLATALPKDYGSSLSTKDTARSYDFPVLDT